MRHTTTVFTIVLIESNYDVASTFTRAANQHFPEAVVMHVNSVYTAIGSVKDMPVPPQLIMLATYSARRVNSEQELSTLTAHLAARPVPVLLLADSGDETDINRYYTKGITAYHVKPRTVAGWELLTETIRNFWYLHARLPLN